MKQTRKKYDAKFKAKVAIEAIQERLTLNELASKYELSPVMISRWKRSSLKTRQPLLKRQNRQMRLWRSRRTDICAEYPETKVSMDGRGWAKDNILIERLWKTIKYECIYTQTEENGTDLFFGIKKFIDDYNFQRRHQGIGRTVPSKRYLWSAA